jgi:glycosyltransferase involved in cell wall biosynthesis
MKKYLIIGDGNSPHILKWARELNKYFELYLVSSTGIRLGLQELIPEENIYDFGLKPEERGGNFQYIRLILPLKRIIGYVSPDYVNAHYITSHGVLAAIVERPSRRNYKLILSAWGTDILITPFKNPFYRAITRLALNRADLVTTDSTAVSDIVHRLSSTHTLRFPFGLDKLPEVRMEDKDEDLFFSNRTLNTNANIDKVLTFFAKVNSENKKAKLIIANDGPEKEYLIDWAKKLGISDAIDFIGFISEKEQEEIYQKAMYYFSILTSDALSVSLLEAMAYGCIPIVSDLPDNTDWVKEGENGMVLKVNSDPNQLIPLKDDYERIFDQNREQIKQRAIFTTAIEKYIRKINDGIDHTTKV